jgi:hypothetical protein
MPIVPTPPSGELRIFKFDCVVCEDALYCEGRDRDEAFRRLRRKGAERRLIGEQPMIFCAACK